MSTRVGPLEAFVEPFRPNLDALVRTVERDAARSKRLIRRLAEEDPEKFFRLAGPILRAGQDSPGAQYVVEILSRTGLLVKTLADPQMTREQALAIAQTASRLDPNTETALARALANAVGPAASETRADEQARLMEILAAVSDGVKIFPFLVRLLRHPNPHIRSKAVLMIGRGNRSATWVRQKLQDSDSRIRANAAEALWGVDTPEAREVLQALVRDSNNRVAGNALLGLYRLGDPNAVSEILGQARHDSPMFRATAAWVMGAAGDPRFMEPLAGLLRDTHPVVRKRAFAAVGAVRAAVARARSGPGWHLRARIVEPEPGRPARRVLFGLTREDGAMGPALLPTQVIASEDGQNVSQYRLVERPLPETMSIVFVLPRGRTGAVRDLLPFKRATDLWGFVYYAAEGDSARVSPRFHSSPEAILAELDRTPEAIECGALWQAVARAALFEASGMVGKRRIIIVNEPAERSCAPENLASGVAAVRAFVQAVSLGPDGRVEEFCRRVGGLYRLGDGTAVKEVYLNLLMRYELVYQPTNWDAETVQLRVHGPGIYAETRVAAR